MDESAIEAGAGALQVGDVVEVRIDALAAGGDGVGRAPDGRAVFVPLAAAGDLLRVRVETLRSRFAHAELVDIVEPGPQRVEPRCEVFGRCGGCAWQHVDYAAQCEAKRHIVEDAMRRVGHLELPSAVTITPSPAPYAYRSRIRLLAGPKGVGYRRRSSHDLCVVRGCPIARPEVEAGLVELAAALPERPGEWEIAVGTRGARAHRVDEAAAPIEIDVDGRPLRVSSGVFFQAHAGLHGALLDALGRESGSGERALELHAGAGFFTRRLASQYAQVVAVEADRRAAKDLRDNFAGEAGVEVRQQRVEAALASRRVRELRPELVVLDPPRSGLARGAAQALGALGARRIVYVSCDPATLARDLAALGAQGFATEHVEAFDAFPQTPHVEVLARLAAREPRSAG